MKLLDDDGWYFHVHLAVEGKWDGRVARIHLADKKYCDYDTWTKISDIVIMRELMSAEYDSLSKQLEWYRAVLRSASKFDELKTLDEYIELTMTRISKQIKEQEREVREDMKNKW